jgi:hypothetical protein
MMLDEGTEFLTRWNGEFENIDILPEDLGHGLRTRNGDVNNFAVRDAVNQWVNWVVNLPRGANCFFALVCHEKDPVFHDGKTPGKAAGTLKYAGGPACPTGPLSKMIAHAADIVIRGVVRKVGRETKRAWNTSVDPRWHQKFRDFSAQSEEELDLRKILLRAGYRL